MEIIMKIHDEANRCSPNFQIYFMLPWPES